MRHGVRIFLTALLAAVVLVALHDVAQACPTCKDGLSQNDPVAQGLVQGYFWSILFMMAMPFLILGGLGGYFYYEIRKAQRNRDSQPASTGPIPVPGQDFAASPRGSA